MLPNDRQRLKQIFAEAAEMDPTLRDAFLRQECGDDQETRAEIEELLAANDQTNSMLDAASVADFLTLSQPTQTLLTGDRVGRFEIIRLIGKGGMGEVYEALDLHFGDRVALKTIRSEFLLRPDFAARFRREIQLARKVTHPNVCRLYDVGRHNIRKTEIAYLTMELLRGETLQERMRRSRVPLEECIPIIRQIAAGLAALHDAEVIHRDLKPANVLLVDSPHGLRVVITDFGLAHPLAMMPSGDSVTIDGQIFGTPAYMAPEQLTGKKVGTSADIYSLGIVMYELLTERRPFELNGLYASVSEKWPRPPAPSSLTSGLDASWDRLVLGCLEPNLSKRPPRMQDVIEKFELTVAGQLRRRTDWFAQRPVRRRTLYTVAAASAAVLIPAQSPRVRQPILRQMCAVLPGSSTWCELPAQKDIAVFPFRIAGAQEANRVAGTGLSTYLRNAFARLFPQPGNVCLHLRNDRLADGVQLVLDGEIEATGREFNVAMSVREARAQGTQAPRLLRTVHIRVPAADARQLHIECLAEFARALDMEYDARTWTAWQNAAPTNSASFAGYLQGLGYVEMGKYEEAIRLLNIAIAPGTDFAFAPAQVGLGDAYRLLRNTSGEAAHELRARQAYRRAVPLDRDFGFAGAERRWGDLEAAVGDTGSAIEHYQAALTLWPFDLQLIKNFAASYEAAGEAAKAEALLKEAAGRARHCWLTHNTLADFYSRHGRFREAESALLEVVRLAPENANAYHNLAFDYIKVGRLDDAIDMASKSIRLREMPRSYSTLGRAYLYRRCNDEAMSNLKRSVQLDGEDFVAWANLAEGFVATAPASADARQAYTRTVELSARHLQKSASAYARAQYGLNLARLGRQSEAVANAERALQQAGASTDIRLLAVGTFEAAGLRQRALAELERALKDGLPLHEAETSFGLVPLRQDPGYVPMLRRLGLDQSADPGGLTPSSPACAPSGKTTPA